MNIVARPSVLPYLSISVLLSLIAGIQFRFTGPLLLSLFPRLPQTAYYLEMLTVFVLSLLPLILWRFTFFMLDAESLQLCSFTLLIIKKKVNLSSVRHIRVIRSGPLSWIAGTRRIEFIDWKGKTTFEWNHVRMSDELRRKLQRTSLLLLAEYGSASDREAKRRAEDI